MAWPFEVGARLAAGMALGALALAAMLARIEWGRPGARRGSRVAAAIVTVLALLALALGPTRAATSGPAAVTLLTPGARGPVAGPAYAVGVDVPGATAIPDLAWLLRHRPELGRITVRGWGLDRDEWPGDDGVLPVSIRPELAQAPAGITDVSWPAGISLGDEFVVRGRVYAACERCSLVLAHAGVPLDSARIGSRDTTFTLRTRPRAVGRWRPVLSFAPRDAAPAETLAVEVRAPVPPRVLLVDQSPSFESRFLKDWLGRQGATVAVRSRLGHARTGVAALNATPDVGLDTAALARWDVVVVRTASLPALTTDERRAIGVAVRENGLGLVLVVDSTVPPSVLPDALPRIDARWLSAAGRGAVARRTRLVWEGASTTSVTVPATGAAPPDGPGSLIRDEAGRVMATAVTAGAGRVAVSLVPGAAQWMLAGDSSAYAAYWSRLLGAVRRAAQDRVAWSSDGGPWFVDRPLTVRAQAASAPAWVRLDEPGVGADTLALVRDTADSSQSWARLRPRAPGWLTVGGPGGLTLFAYDTSRWQALQARRRVEATLAHAGPGARADGPRQRRLPLRWPFFVLFVVAAGWLWSTLSTRTPD